MRKEGILGGSSTGTLLAAALKYCREQTIPKRVVSLVCDSGAKYLSKVFSDAFVAQEGWLDRPSTGTVRDLVINRFADGGTIVVAPEETLRSAFARMRAADVSQLPVIENGKLVGLIDESDVLDRLAADPRAFASRVREAMATRLETVPAHAPLAALQPLFAAGLVPIVVEGDQFLGLVTRIDLINELRKNPQ